MVFGVRNHVSWGGMDSRRNFFCGRKFLGGNTLVGRTLSRGEGGGGGTKFMDTEIRGKKTFSWSMTAFSLGINFLEETPCLGKESFFSGE